jgi:hypothetical protein
LESSITPEESESSYSGTQALVSVSTTGSTLLQGEELLNNTAVALVAFGKATNGRIVERCIRSIRTRGQWPGYIYIITDAGYQDLLKEDSKVIVIHPRKEDDPSLQKVKGKMRFKRFKTLVIDYLEKDDRLQNIENIVYMDIDNVMGASLLEFLGTQVSTYYSKADDVSNMLMFPPSKRHPNTIHSGIILLHRQYSKHCLEHWRELMDKNPSVDRDQAHIEHIERQGRESGCKILLMPIDYRLFPEKSQMRKKHKRTFVHITNTGRAKRIPKSVQKSYLESILNLTKEERESPTSLAVVQTF